MNLTNLTLGIIILLLGRKFFWLFIGILGFLLGMEYGQMLFPSASGLVVLVISLGTGIVGAALAIFAQWIMVMAGGFLAGAYLVRLLTGPFMPEASELFALLGGIIGAAVLVLTFDWALIILSSLLGAALIADAMGITAGMSFIVTLIILAAAGVAVQGMILGSEERADEKAVSG